MSDMLLIAQRPRLELIRTGLRILWIAGVLGGIGLFLRALRFVDLLPAESSWESLIWAVPTFLAALWLAFAIRWYRETTHFVSLRVCVLSTLPFLPIAVLGFLLHPPFHTGIELLWEIGEIVHLVRGGKVFLGTLVVLSLYLHVLIGGIGYLNRHDSVPLPKALGETAAYMLPIVAALALLTVGLAQALTYISIAFDDQVRYWSVADALARGQGYPFRTFDEVFGDTQGIKPYWTDDLPVWPLTMTVGFFLFGHTTVATYAPLIAANIAMPIVAFLAVRKISGDLTLSVGAAITLVLFPMYQIYALGAAEPEPIFHLLLLAMVASVPRNGNWRHWVIFGSIAGLVVLTRPEGGIYAAVTLAVLLVARWREAGYWVSAVVAAVPTLLYAGETLRQTGKPWPLHRSTYFGLENLQKHWDGFSDIGAIYYSDLLRTTTLGFWIILFATVVLFGVGTVWLALRRPVFLFLPAAAGAHVLILWLTEAGPALTNVENPPDFFRHMSHALPFAWITASIGIFALARRLRQQWRQWLLVGVFVLGTYYSYQILITPEVTYGSAGILLPASKERGLLTADTFVLAQDLFSHPFQLPEIQHAWQDGVLQAQPWDYLGFRTSVFEFYSSFDMHNVDVGKPYMMTSFYASLFAYVTLALAAFGIPMARKEAKKRSWWRTASQSRSADS